MKTMCLTDRIDWDSINKRINGVHKLDETTMGMVFENPGYGTTRIISTNCSKVVVFNTVHVNDVIDSPVEDEEMKIMDIIWKSYQSERAPVMKIIHNYYVFKMETTLDSDILLFEYQLRSRGIETVLDFELYNALVVKHRGVTWHIFNSDNILAIVGGYDMKESSKMIEESWGIIKG